MATITPAVGSSTGSDTSSGAASPTFTGTARAPRFVTDPVTLTATSGTITPNAALSCLFRYTATAGVTLADPINGVNGQAVTVEIEASGADRVVSFPGGTPASVTVPSGEVLPFELRLRGSTWMLHATGTVGGGSGSGGGTTAVIDAAAPPAGLSPITADGSNERAALQALLTYVKTTYGSGTVVGLHDRAIRCDTGITVPARVQLRHAKLNGAAMTSGTLVTCDDTGFTPLHGVELVGPGGTNTVVGLAVSGARCDYNIPRIYGFGKGVKLTNDDTYIINFNGGWWGNCDLIADMDYLAGSTQNAGEGIHFNDITFDNSQKIAQITGNQASVFFDRCHQDFCVKYVEGNNASVFFSNSHFETNAATTSQGYLMNPWDNARWHFTACKFILGSAAGVGIPHIINPAAGPANYGNGSMRWANCDAYSTDTSGAGGVDSEGYVAIPSGQTSVTFRTPFATKWGPVTALPAWNDNGGYVSGFAEIPRVVVQKNGSNNITGQVTVSVSSAPSAILPIRVIF